MPFHVSLRILMSTATLALAGCTVGPNYSAQTPPAPQDWTSWRSADPALIAKVSQQSPLPPDWWTLYNDATLNELERRALAGAPDLDTAALHVAQARVEAGASASQGLPQLNATASVTRNRLSENGSSTRLFDVLAGSNRDTLAKYFAGPFTLSQGGLEASWEPDLWGKIRRTMEEANAGVAGQQALLDMARLSLVSDVAQAYGDLRSQQARIAAARALIAALTEQLDLVRARTEGGASSGIDLSGQRVSLQQVEAQLPGLLVAETASRNRIALLLGERPGALAELLAARPDTPLPTPPADLSPGLPSELARRRPDIRAAEAKLHAATAKIGVATADLYPSIRFGGSFKLESYKEENLFDWASRTWSIGPSFNLPIFDGARRKRVVELRRLEEREAAVAYQKTVLSAWGDIDNALSAYEAERQTLTSLSGQTAAARDKATLIAARYTGGAANYMEVLGAKAIWLQAAQAEAESAGRLASRYAALNKALGNVPDGQD